LNASAAKRPPVGQRLATLLPEPFLTVVNRLRLWNGRLRFARMSRADAFAAIYRDRCWGYRSGEKFSSGTGSADPYASDYCRVIEEYVTSNHITSIVDLGCGDFLIGHRLANLVPEYCGADIVPELVEHNRRRHGSPRVRFACLDIVDHSLPSGELCLIRQVLQHLSNAEIEHVLAKLHVYPHVIITEHVPSGDVPQPNRDKPHGPDTRLYDGSGVFVALPPFSQPIRATWELPYDTSSQMLAVALGRVGLG
jgi:Methyltransferase domain